MQWEWFAARRPASQPKIKPNLLWACAAPYLCLGSAWLHGQMGPREAAKTLRWHCCMSLQPACESTQNRSLSLKSLTLHFLVRFSSSCLPFEFAGLGGGVESGRVVLVEIYSGCPGKSLFRSLLLFKTDALPRVSWHQIKIPMMLVRTVDHGDRYRGIFLV